MSIKPQRIFAEQWNPSKEQIDLLLPMDDIAAEIGRDPGIKVLRDDEIRLAYPSLYNISVQARAHNLELVELLQEYYDPYKNSPELTSLLGVQLPQIKWVDTLGFEESVISVHLSKLNKTEVFINDIVLVKNDDFDSLSDGVLDKVFHNISVFAREQGAKFLSGYAVDKNMLNLLKRKGFGVDRREIMGNDYIWEIAAMIGEQFPYYKEL
ncbi:hypothetical protein [Desulfosporosinus sp. Sb-LF]|uniref:hypothetical protein n=1 Tax=Desulfosporosinus sp. Sb-LF TaxID=2560027 RepID=UPI00107F5BE2|nr:hypothetical protein [Desulfosporosinus sp. Sb-LF]TGE33630.1 hypothetical protein E4K68_05670 [Desulfosporosinus sp. Sb-LF]